MKTLIALALTAAALQVQAAQPAPDFTLKTLSGRNLRLNEQRGQVVMLNFWATWCGPCKQEMPHLNRLHDKYRDTGFVLLGINVDVDPAKAAADAAKLGIGVPVLLDGAKTVSKLYGLAAMPTTVVIDRDRASAVGVTADQIENGLYDAYGQRWISTIYAPNNQYKVLMESEPRYQADPTMISLLHIRSGNGQLVPLDTLARVDGHSLRKFALRSIAKGATLKFAVAHGTANAHKVMEDIKAGGKFSECHFIEFMACPGGCLGGGGQPMPTNKEIRAARAKAIYTEDHQLDVRKSYENPAVLRVYEEFLTDGPCGHKSHELLHTHYVDRGKHIE